jgi:hypothetical protein
MVSERIYGDVVARVLASPAVLTAKPPRGAAWPLPCAEPADVRALYDACDGLTLSSGVALFGRGELRDVTQWLVLEKGLEWPPDLVVVGERRDSVIVLDLDEQGARAGGGVLEVANDDLGVFERMASGLVAYLAIQAGAGHDPSPPPEVAARLAAAQADPAALARELERPLYPGQPRLAAALGNRLGELFAQAGQSERAWTAFEAAVRARVSAAGRGALEAERKAGWRAAALACRASGAEALAQRCEARAEGERV